MLYTVTRIVIVRMWQSTKAKVTREAELWPIIKVHSHRLGFSLWLLQLLHGIQPPGQLPTPPSDMQAIFDIVWRRIYCNTFLVKHPHGFQRFYTVQVGTQIISCLHLHLFKPFFINSPLSIVLSDVTCMSAQHRIRLDPRHRANRKQITDHWADGVMRQVEQLGWNVGWLELIPGLVLGRIQITSYIKNNGKASICLCSVTDTSLKRPCPDVVIPHQNRTETDNYKCTRLRQHELILFIFIWIVVLPICRF